MTIAEKIKMISDRNGMTIRELAIKAGIPEQSLRSMLKRDDYKFSSILQIAKALDITLFVLLESENLSDIDNKWLLNQIPSSGISKLEEFSELFEKLIITAEKLDNSGMKSTEETKQLQEQIIELQRGMIDNDRIMIENFQRIIQIQQKDIDRLTKLNKLKS